MSGDGIRSYAGEFLISPAGLELSMNWCSHNCSYCFANHTKPNRKADFASIVGLLTNYQSRKSREALLLQAKVPMLISNHVDPFAGSNAQQFEPIWEICVELGVEITWQTRGAHKPQQNILKRIVEQTPKSVWYISIPMVDDQIRKQVEPNAPSIESRFELIQQLKEVGHVVVVGINPCCLDWLPDCESLLEKLKTLGVWGVWAQALYMGKFFKENMDQKSKKNIGNSILKDCGQYGRKIDIRHKEQILEIAKKIGLEVFCVGHEGPTKYFDPYDEIYSSPMPYWHQLINAIDQQYDNHINGKTCKYMYITRDSLSTFLHPLPDIDWAEPLRHKRASHFREITNPTGRLPKIYPEDFWDIVWNDDLFCKRLGPLAYGSFAYAAIKEKETIQPLLDENGNKIIVYSRNGFSSLYAHTPELA